MSAAFDAETENPVIRPIWFLWLDVEGDPLYAHTGLGNVTFGSGETGDSGLDGRTFEGLGYFADMGDIEESENGSGAVTLTLPGVDPTLPGFAPLIAEARRWQFRRAVLWFSYLAADGRTLIDYPEREKTGRLDNLGVIHGDQTCTISISIEGFAASSGPPLNSQYADQPQIDPTDISQSWVANLINRQPEIGPGTTQPVDRRPRGRGITDRRLRLPHAN